MGAEYRAATKTAEQAQVKAAAYSGLHYAAAVLSDPTTLSNSLEGNPANNQSMFGQIAVPASGSIAGAKQAYFSIRSPALDPASGPNSTYLQPAPYGVIDEGGKLNINALIALDPTGNLLANALTQIFTQLQTLTGNTNADVATIVDSIVDWVDSDETPRANGAESSYYSSLTNPYMSKNGPLNSLDELLLVQGMDYRLLYGDDTNRNGIQDGNETGNTPGLASFITVYGRELNLSSSGTPRIYLNSSDLSTMYQNLIAVLGQDLAAYILASKLFTATPVAPTLSATVVSGSGSGGSVTIALTQAKGAQTQTATSDQLATAVQTQITALSSSSNPNSGQRIKSLTSLIGTQITLPRQAGAAANSPSLVAYSPLNDATQLPTLLPLLMDNTTVQQEVEMVPRINVNTAPYEVLMSIVDQNGNPMLTDTTVQAIITQRATQLQTPSDPATLSLAWLITTNTITAAQYNQLSKYITGTSMVYRVQSIGYLNGGGPVARMEAVIDTNQGSPRFLLVRDLADIDNPPAFPPNQ
jgi:type II secretory pathway component PulK